MNEPINIVVNQQSQGNALSETEARIKSLYQAAAAYENKGMFDAAKSARADARSLEKDLTRESKERLLAERAVTTQKAEQAAIERAQLAMANQRRTRILNAAAGAIESTAGASPLRGVTGALGVGNPIASIGMAIAAAVTGAMASFSRQAHDVDVMNLEAATGRAVSARRLQRLASFEGTSGAAREAEMSSGDELVRLQAERDELEKKAEVKWFDPSSWWGAITGRNRNALLKNSADQQTASDNMRTESEIKSKKFSQDGAKEIEIAEKKAKGEMASAKAVEMALQYHREIIRVQQEGGTKEDAIRGADAKFAADIRQREQSLAGLISARTGASAAARIASIGGRQFDEARTAVATQRAIEKQTEKMDSHHNDAQAARTRRNFSPPPLR